MLDKPFSYVEHRLQQAMDPWENVPNEVDPNPPWEPDGFEIDPTELAHIPRCIHCCQSLSENMCNWCGFDQVKHTLVPWNQWYANFDSGLFPDPFGRIVVRTAAVPNFPYGTPAWYAELHGEEVKELDAWDAREYKVYTRLENFVNNLKELSLMHSWYNAYTEFHAKAGFWAKYKERIRADVTRAYGAHSPAAMQQLLSSFDRLDGRLAVALMSRSHHEAASGNHSAS